MADGFDKARTEIDLVEFVREHVDPDVRRRGSNFAISCPRHVGADSDPSFIIFPRRNRFHCYHCGDWHGSVIDLVMGMRHCTEVEALEYLSTLYPELDLMAGGSGKAGAVSKFLAWQTKNAEEAHERLMASDMLPAIADSRRLSLATITEFKLGLTNWTGHERLAIPQFDKCGRVLAFVTRKLDRADPLPKYWAKNMYCTLEGKMAKDDDPDKVAVWLKGSYLYGLAEALPTAPLYLVEGHLDRLASYELGMRNFAAIGTNMLVAGQIALLEAFPAFVLVLDNDEVGRRSLKENLELLRAQYPDKPVFHCGMPIDVKDVGDVLKDTSELTSANIREHFLSSMVPAEVELVKRIREAAKARPALAVTAYKDVLALATEPITRAMVLQTMGPFLDVDPSLLSFSL